MRHSAIQRGPSFWFLMAVGGALIAATIAADERLLLPADSVEGQAPAAAKEFVGPQACVECHRAEFRVWSRTNHATNAFDLLRTSSNAKQYAGNLGLDPDRVASDPRCLACHSTPQSKAAENTGVVLGVTCEACHNAAGGEEGWLNIHATYGLRGQRREEETPEHRQQRIDRCRAAGQNRSDDLYSLAKQCYECHLVGDEELVVRGGHHPGDAGFEMTNWFAEKLRHNLFLDPQHNGPAPSLWVDPHWRPNRQPGKDINHRRIMYLVATLVDLEVSLRNRGRARHASYASAAATRVAAAAARLKVITTGGAVDELEKALEAIAKLEPVLFVPPDDGDAKSFIDAAEQIRGIARQISSADQGERFSAVDQLLGSPSEPVPATEK